VVLGACGGGGGPTVSTPEVIVPSDGLPAEVMPMTSNNNLDVVRHEGRVYLAFRTAAAHYAGPEVTMYVVSSSDEKTWTYETSIAIGTDVREPRFLSWNGRLFLYFAVLGKDPLAFEPQGFRMTERTAAGWTAPVDVYRPGFMDWRAKVVNGKPYIVAYVGGESIYTNDGQPLEIHWLTTSDGRELVPVIPGQPVVEKGGGSETDFVILDDGTVIAVTRNEAGDESGWGSKICRAEAATPGDWHCASDPRKYDSPLLFRHGGEIYLLARRNLTETGNYDLMLRDLSVEEQSRRYEFAYAQERKRCSLWRVDPRALRVDFVLDLPSKGDTCFPAILDDGGDDIVVYNYSSRLDDDLDPVWFAGQLRPTYIYRMTLSF